MAKKAPARKPTEKAPVAASLTDRERVRSALKRHLEELVTRAKRERAGREAKWRENRLTAEGEVYSLGDKQAVAAGNYRAGDTGKERLRVARQKVVAAKVALGDAIYKNNRVPFLLQWAATSGFDDADALERIRRRVDELCYVGNMPDQLRVVIEESAGMGEAWLRGRVTDDGAGRPVPIIEAVSPWEMYFDEAGNADLENAEYVIQARRISPWEVAQLVQAAPAAVFDVEAIKQVMATAGTRGRGADTSDIEKPRDGSALIEWKEFWCKVPESLIAAGADDTAPIGLGGHVATLDWVPVMAVLADDRLVAAVHGAAVPPVPYYRVEWDIDRMRALPQGVYDVMGPTQEVMTGVVRAWLSNLRRASRITLAGKREKIRQDPEQIAEGVDFIDLDPDTRDVREAIQQIQIESLTGGLTQAIEMLLEFADLESAVPRIQQGVQPAGTATAFELRSRLAASGKYLNEIVRRHDGAVRWVIGFVLYVLELTGELQSGSAVDVVPKGFTQFEDLVRRLDGLLRLLSLGAQNPRVDRLVNHEAIVKQVAEADDLEPGKVLLSHEDLAARDQAEAESAERQIALADAQATLRGKEARALRDEAAAEQARGKLQLDRGKFIHDVERGGGGAAPAAKQPAPGVSR